MTTAQLLPSKRLPAISFDRLVGGLASLKLTVVLLLAANFLVLAGTFAQVEKDLWQVVDEYFRTSIAWIEFRVFFPQHWFPRLPEIRGGIPFPGGWLIGVLMLLNLLAAHLLRFRVVARGHQLVTGTLLLTVGFVTLYLVVARRGIFSESWSTDWIPTDLWFVCRWALLVAYPLALGLLLLFRRMPQGGRMPVGILSVGWAALCAWIWLVEVPPSGSMRVVSRLLEAALIGLILLAGCTILFGRRGGVVLVHGGLATMMLAEVLTGTLAAEGHMRIEEGQTINYVESNRHHELAVVQKNVAGGDQVTVIPSQRLRPGEIIVHQQLPFDLRVVESYANSQIVSPGMAGKSNPATAGLGRRRVAVEQPTVSGTSNEVNLPSIYVELRQKGSDTSLGIYLFGLFQSLQDEPERILVGETEYEVSLRRRRTYKPYSIRLEDFRFDKYVGTMTPKNFSSDIRLTDPSRGVDRNVRIWMNNPLRHARDTLYQSGHSTTADGAREVSILQVVTNPSWMLPYVASMMVAIGLFTHFFTKLTGFLKRRETASIQLRPANESPSVDDNRPARGRTISLVVVLAATVFWGWRMMPPTIRPTAEMDLFRFGSLPVVYEGRVKPLDSLARNTLSKLSKTQTYRDKLGDRQPAIRWLLSIITAPAEARKIPVFRIENMDVLQTLGLERRQGYRYAFNEFSGALAEIDRQMIDVRSRKQEDWTTYQRKLVELDGKIRSYRLLEDSFASPTIRADRVNNDLMAAWTKSAVLARQQPPLSVPTSDADSPWQSFFDARLADMGHQAFGEKARAPVDFLEQIFAAYKENNPLQFNRETAHYQAFLAQRPPYEFDADRLRLESHFNHAQPFFWASLLYLLAFLFSAASWLGWSQPLNRIAFWLIVMTLVVHTLALGARIYISGRPPVTNLYSSAVFIGWAAVILGLALESIYRLGVGNLLAAVSGFMTLMVAFFLSRSGDTFVVLQAVLDTQFWLATHVVCITLGYATTFVAGFLGVLYVLLGLFTRSLSRSLSRELTRMIYGTVCFALFFSFVGTVLGGLWADDSWGRFWGWDPKENGALIIVLWNATLLHARWAGIIKQRGVALFAIGGNICTAWSWFGTNELGVGLHSYGFTEGVLLALIVFCASQLAVVLAGLTPVRFWRTSGDVEIITLSSNDSYLQSRKE